MAEQEQMDLPTEMTETEAADAMVKAGLFADPPTDKPAAKGPAKDPVTGKFVKKEREPEVEAAEGDTEPEEEAEEAEPEETPEGETKEEKAIRLLKVKEDGMEVEKPEDEVVAGYMRQADYTRKTQAHAERVKRFEAEEVTALRQEREYYKQNSERLLEVLNELDPDREPDWAALARDLPPEEFSQRFAAYKSRQDARTRLQAEHARIRELEAQETTRERAARLAKEMEALETAIPEMKDPEKGKVLREDLMAYARSIGFSDDDIGGVEDHRALVILDKARRYDESQKRRPKLEEKVEKAIAGLKPAGAPPRPKAKELAQAKTRLLQTGSEEDAAAAMKAAKIFG